MGSFALVIAVLFIIFIILFELIRKKESFFDFLTVINGTFLLLYGIVPIYLYFFIDTMTWTALKRTDLGNTSFFQGQLLALLFYVVVIITYIFTKNLTINKNLIQKSSIIYSKVGNKHFFKTAIILYVIGMISWVIYVRELGGYEEYMRLGRLLRHDGSLVQTPLAFLKHFNSLLTISTFLFFAFIKNEKGIKKVLTIMLFASSMTVSIIVLIQNSGRISLLVFLIILPLANMIKNNKIKPIKITVIGIAFVLLVLFGGELFKYGQETSYVAPKTKIETVNSLMEEFSFPYNNLGNLVPLYPEQFSFRYGFIDTLRAVLQFIPSRIISFDFIDNQTVSQFNTTLYNNYGQIPVDIVSFGYVSFGVSGVMILALIFGVIIKLTESFFSSKQSLVASIFYVSFALQAGLAVIYGDPHQVYMSLFKYIFSIIVLLTVIRLPKIVWK